MKLILTADVNDLGKRGDVVDVADGYARNFLLPRSYAVKATSGALEQAEAVREARIEAERKAKEEAETIATQLVGSRVVIAAQAGDEGVSGAADARDGVPLAAGRAVARSDAGAGAAAAAGDAG